MSIVSLDGLEEDQEESDIESMGSTYAEPPETPKDVPELEEDTEELSPEVVASLLTSVYSGIPEEEVEANYERIDDEITFASRLDWEDAEILQELGALPEEKGYTPPLPGKLRKKLP